MNDVGTVRLRDGRALGYYEYGDSDGQPCLYVPGTPASGLAGRAYEEAARRNGLRFIAVDKPGYGRSDPVKPRTLSNFAADIVDLVAALQLRSVCLFGESGGGPQALAAAAALGTRVRLTVVAAGMAPSDDPAVLREMTSGNRQLLRVARLSPSVVRLPMWALRRRLLDPVKRDAYVQAQMTRAAPAERAALVGLMELGDVTAAARDALRRGTGPVAAELAMLARPWKIELARISSRVELWHGSDDMNVPPVAALFLAKRLPEAVAHVIEGEGHAVGWTQRHALLASLADAAAMPGGAS